MAFVLALVALVVCCPVLAGEASARTWVAPLGGALVVRRAFDPPATRWGAGHRGVDLAAFAGAAVRAAGAGTVTFAGTLAGRGVLVVSHGAVRTTYEPVVPLVRTARRVGAGDVVAVLAAGHGRAGPGEALLHWGLLRGVTYLDPLALLPREPSRLVPVPPEAPAAGGALPAPLGALAAPLGAPDRAGPPTVGTATVLSATVLAAADPARVPADPARAPADPTRAPAVPPDAVRALGAAGALGALGALGVLGAWSARLWAVAAARGLRAALSRAGRRACRAAAARPSCASGRSGSRSRPGPGRSPPA